MRKFFAWVNRNKDIAIRLTLVLPIALAIIVSISHVTIWYKISNPDAWSMFLSISVEAAAICVLLAIIVGKPGWHIYFPFLIITCIQIIGNCFFNFNYADENSLIFKNWKLFSEIVIGEEAIEPIKSKFWLSLISGSSVPLLSLLSLHLLAKFELRDAPENPITENIVPPAMENIVPPVTENIIPTVTENIVQPVTENIVQPVTENIVQPVTENIVPPVTENIVPPVTENIIPTVTENIVQPATENIVQPATENIVPPVTENIVQPATENIVQPATENIVPPVTENIVPPVTENIVPPATENIVPPATKKPVIEDFISNNNRNTVKTPIYYQDMGSRITEKEHKESTKKIGTLPKIRKYGAK